MLAAQVAMGSGVNPASSSANGSQGTAQWSLRLLGGFELASVPAGERLALPGKRERLLLAYLALSPNGRASRRKLAALFWGDTAEEAALHSLRNCLSALRKALGDAERRTLSSQGEDIVLDLSAFDTDVLTFRRLAAYPDRAELEAAAELCSGDLLEGLGIESEEFESWRRTESVCHRDQSVEVLARLMAQFEVAGETERAIETGTRILELEPLHEMVARKLMRLYGRSGRRGAAIGVYRSLAAALRAEIGAEPEAETRALFADISRGTDDGGVATLPSAGRELTPPPQAAPHPEKPKQPLQARHVFASMVVSSEGRSYKVFAVLGVVLAGAVLAMFLWPQLRTPSRVISATQATSHATDTVTSLPRDVVTIAVVPFANLSGDASQEFFSDGITDEINTALAKVPGVNVVGRSSAFALKGQNKDARTVGQMLGVSHLIEGSVRKAGQGVRISAQLVRAHDGVELWSQGYDRNLTDIFVVQEEIATSIIGALRVPLALGNGENLVNNRSIDPDSYEKYLRGKALWLARGGVSAAIQERNLIEAATLLEGVVVKSPSYAPAWAFLSATYFDRASNSTDTGDIADARATVNEFRIKGEAAGQKAVQLDANLAVAYASLAVFAWSRSKPLEAEELFKKALALDPVDPNALAGYGFRIGSAGRWKEALDLVEKAHRADPFYPVVARGAPQYLWLNGQNESAIALAKTLRPADRAMYLALIYASMRRFDEAGDTLMELAAGDGNSNMAQAARLLRMNSAQLPSVEPLPRLLPPLSMLYFYLGDRERALLPYERMVDIGLVGGGIRGTAPVWHADFAPLRKTERFKALMRKAGHVEYWRAKGWPEQCHPTTGDDFECD
jgi:TolB-like protein/DNA-binding SARP family transcriptional activator/tetratricopeptide (TPR) repeat protein